MLLSSFAANAANEKSNFFKHKLFNVLYFNMFYFFEIKMN